LKIKECSWCIYNSYSVGWPRHAVTSDLIWHQQIPLKVSVMVWRLLRNRLPTKDNLVRRHIIPPDVSLCATGCGGAETAHHLFISCLIFAPLWCLVRSWVGISSADLSVLHDHFLQFTHSAGGSRAHRSFMQLLWLCCIWWFEQNNRIFKTNEHSPSIDRESLGSFPLVGESL
jgi:hypothetical protein